MNKGRTHKIIHRHSRRRGKIARTKQALAGAAQNVKSSLNHIPDSVAGFAKRNPVKIVGVSLLAGVALAQLLRLRHK